MFRGSVRVVLVFVLDSWLNGGACGLEGRFVLYVGGWVDDGECQLGTVRWVL